LDKGQNMWKILLKKYMLISNRGREEGKE
jgi:hypothetical protein